MKSFEIFGFWDLNLKTYVFIPFCAKERMENYLFSDTYKNYKKNVVLVMSYFQKFIGMHRSEA